jgi:hypothetical protein
MPQIDREVEPGGPRQGPDVSAGVIVGEYA